MRRPVDLILASMEEEVGPLLDRLEDRRPFEIGRGGGALVGEDGPDAWAGELAGRPVVVAVTGDGPVLARSGAEAAIREAEPARVLVVGIAGGLTSGLGVGDLVLSAVVGREDGETLRPGEPDVDGLAAALGVRSGAVLTAEKIASSTATKDRLRNRAAAILPGAPAVVDLESFVVARVAEELGTPWLVLRSTSDRADEALPDFLEECRDARGSVDRGEVAARAFARPAALPRLYRLKRRVGSCARELAGRVGELLERWDATESTSSAVAGAGGTRTPDPAGGVP